MAETSTNDLNFIKEARTFYNDWQASKKDYETQADETKRLEKQVADQQKAYTKEMETAVNEGRSVVEDKFASDLKVLKNDLNEAKGKKNREWDKAKKKRISDEVKPLQSDISVHREAMWDQYTAGKIPKIFFNRVYVRLFCPRGIVERLILLLVYLVISFGVPALFYLISKDRSKNVLIVLIIAFLIVIALIYFAFWKAGAGKDWKAMTNARREYDHILVTKKKIKAIENQILQDQNEDRYDIGDETLAVSEAQAKYDRLNNQYKQEMDIFNQETKPEIEASVKEKFEGPLKEMSTQLEEQRKTFAVAKSLYEHHANTLQNTYMPVFGKRYFKAELLEQIEDIIKDNHASTVADAINYMKNSKGI